jgi:predicted amidohydrolase
MLLERKPNYLVKGSLAMLKLDTTVPWSPHTKATPNTSRTEDLLSIDANKTRTLSGGWQLSYDSVDAGASYRISVEVDFDEIAVWRDALQCKAVWGEIAPDDEHCRQPWDYLTPELVGDNRVRFSRTLRAPEKTQQLTLRYTLRWTPSGHTRWSLPQIEKVEASAADPVRIAVATGTASSRRQHGIKGINDNVEFYADLCRRCAGKADLIVLPEVALQWQLPGSPLDVALPCPGTETEVFAEIARRQKTQILLGLFENEGDAVRNSAVLFDTNGQITGRYYKVHLAVGGESESGILPGDSFPVFDTALGRIGCNICMDVSAAESARMVGLNGADFLLLPIMGDHRADRWSQGPPVFNESRWQAIMRTRALDTQLTFVVARNEGQGSCIVDRKGDFLAYNDGTEEIICATVDADDGFRTWNGGDFRGINWMQRRPHVYGEYVEAENRGSL